MFTAQYDSARVDVLDFWGDPVRLLFFVVRLRECRQFLVCACLRSHRICSLLVLADSFWIKLVDSRRSYLWEQRLDSRNYKIGIRLFSVFSSQIGLPDLDFGFCICGLDAVDQKFYAIWL
jgi:hypothetical protein